MLPNTRGVGIALGLVAGLSWACSSTPVSPGGSDSGGSTSGGSSATNGGGGDAGSASQSGGAGVAGEGGESQGAAGSEGGEGGGLDDGGESSGGAGGEGGGSEGGSGGDSSAGNDGEGGDGGSDANVGACGEHQTFEGGLTPSREIFVDAEAASSGDGSRESPYATLDEALTDVTPGTAVRLLPGTHVGDAFASGLVGTADEPIWIGGVPGEGRPVLSGGDQAFQLSAVSYVVVHDLVVTGQAANGINVDDGGDREDEVTHHVVFRNLEISDIGSGGNQDCLKLSGVYDFHVLDSEFVGCSGGSAIDHVGCHRGIIARNTFRDLGGNGVQNKGGSADLRILGNRFLEAGERAVNLGGSTGFEFFRPPLSAESPNAEARNIQVVGNVFEGGTSPIAFVGCVDCLAANNTIVDPVRWVFRILQETVTTTEYEFLPSSNGRFVNNLVSYTTAALSTHVNVGPDTAPETFRIENNLWYASDSPGDSEPSSLPVEEEGGIYGEEPGFVDAASSDYRIAGSSPASGAGVSLEEAVADESGACFLDPPSIGAYEPN